MNRYEVVESIKQNPELSVLIIGGGINGIGVFRELALQGVDVLLVEKNDFCSGASAASSHMVHGGIRYLENGEFRLVREAVHERNRLLVNAPHLVKPLPTTIPIFKWFSGLFNAPLKFLRLLDKPAERGVIVIKLGLLLYDAYTRRQGTVPPHKFLSRTESMTKFPGINPYIICTATYFDAAMPIPERICLEVLLDAEKDVKNEKQRVMAANYLRLTGLDNEKVILYDELAQETIAVKPKVIINATGAWIDLTNNLLGDKTRFIGGTKGSHIVLNNPELRSAIGENEFFFENFDGRIVLIFPLYDKVLVGTSDLFCDDPDAVRCTQEEVDYFLSMIKKVFPKIETQKKQIVFSFSGVRPLPVADVAHAGQVSRDHSIKKIYLRDRSMVVFNLIGGKWTTFRAFSEEVTNVILDYLKLPRLHHTRELPIGGGRDYPRTQQEKEDRLQSLLHRTGLPRQRLEELFERYGTRSEAIASYIARAKGKDHPLQNKPDYSVGEISYLVQFEKVIHLDDLVLRRVPFAMCGELTYNLLEELSYLVGEVLGWSNELKRDEVERTLRILDEKHDVILSKK